MPAIKSRIQPTSCEDTIFSVNPPKDPPKENDG